jgi:hypothetical protein
MSEQQPEPSELLARSPEEQIIIDTAIDLLLDKSVDFPALQDGRVNHNAIAQHTFEEAGLMRAVVTLAIELDGTQRGIDRVANFYLDRFLQSERIFPNIKELVLAHDLALSYGVSPDIGEKLVAAEIKVDFPEQASKIAEKVLGRNLTIDEILALVDKHTHGASRGGNDREQYVGIAERNSASPDVIRQIHRAFDDFDWRWSRDLT